MVELGDFACVPTAGTVGTLISFGEWLNGNGFSKYDHAEIYVGMADKRSPHGYTFSAYPGGARLQRLQCPVEQLPGAIWSTGHFDLTDDQRKLIVQNALSLTGTPYGWLDYFVLAAHRLHILLPWFKDYIASTKHMICSQIVDYIYMISGIHLFNDGRWPGFVTPADLAHLIGG